MEILLVPNEVLRLKAKKLTKITKEDIIKGNEKSQIKSGHPIELMAVSYGFLNKDEMSE